jgi:transposase
LRQACELLGLSYRQGKRLWARYRTGGGAGLQHGLCGRASNHGYGGEFRAVVLQRVAERYQDFGPTLASEHLAADDQLQVSAETLRRWLRAAGQPCVRKRKAYRKRRKPKAHFGELVQLDGSFHDWLEDRGPKGCLMHLVDDATSTALFSFSKEETTWDAANLLRAWIERYDVPKALYTDWKSVYVSEPTEKQRLRGEEPVSQFGRMCARLGIRIIAAGSPQAKGRVGRAHGTHQDRLVKKLRLAGIASYEEANCFIAARYMADHNRRFAHRAASEADFHRKRPSKAELDAIFCLEQERVLSLDWVVSYEGRLLQLERQSRHHAPAKSKVLVRENQQGQIHIEYRGRRLSFTEIERRLTPARNHPWQQSYKQMQTPAGAF